MMLNIAFAVLLSITADIEPFETFSGTAEQVGNTLRDRGILRPSDRIAPALKDQFLLLSMPAGRENEAPTVLATLLKAEWSSKNDMRVLLRTQEKQKQLESESLSTTHDIVKAYMAKLPSPNSNKVTERDVQLMEAAVKAWHAQPELQRQLSPSSQLPSHEVLLGITSILLDSDRRILELDQPKFYSNHPKGTERPLPQASEHYLKRYKDFVSNPAIQSILRLHARQSDVLPISGIVSPNIKIRIVRYLSELRAAALIFNEQGLLVDECSITIPIQVPPSTNFHWKEIATNYSMPTPLSQNFALLCRLLSSAPIQETEDSTGRSLRDKISNLESAEPQEILLREVTTILRKAGYKGIIAIVPSDTWLLSLPSLNSVREISIGPLLNMMSQRSGFAALFDVDRLFISPAHITDSERTQLDRTSLRLYTSQVRTANFESLQAVSEAIYACKLFDQYTVLRALRNCLRTLPATLMWRCPDYSVGTILGCNTQSEWNTLMAGEATTLSNMHLRDTERLYEALTDIGITERESESSSQQSSLRTYVPQYSAQHIIGSSSLRRVVTNEPTFSAPVIVGKELVPERRLQSIDDVAYSVHASYRQSGESALDVSVFCGLRNSAILNLSIHGIGFCSVSCSDYVRYESSPIRLNDLPSRDKGNLMTAIRRMIGGHGL
ncbi:MAG TPA: hypothetical protein PLX06_03865 [Fimbriimonadaceae bacterium]|nr:hypothetical protein [Fimbriimonadaceae bacterium]